MSLQQVLMMTPQQAQTTTATQYYLPSELWGLVLYNITDDYTLWVVCRQVSRLFRSEAEREFLLHRLPSLTLSWDFMFPHHNIDYELHIKQAKCLGVEAKTLSRVKFSFSAENTLYRKDTETVLSTRPRWQGQRFKRDVDALFSYKDMSSLKPMLARDGYYRAMLGYYSNDVPLPDLQYDVIEQTLSFDWTAFANNFFKDAKFVQSRFNTTTTTTTTTSFTNIAEDSLGKFFTKYNMNSKEAILKGLGLVKQGWQEKFEKDFDFFWQEAYVRRLRRTNPLGLQRLEGKDETGVRIRKKMAKYFQQPRQAWCTDVVTKYCEKRLQQLEIGKL